jgi:glutamate-ammonia-ligase adenylyltransferase
MIDDAQTHVLPKSRGRLRPARAVLRGGRHGALPRAAGPRSSGGWRPSPGAFFAPLEAETPAPEIGEEAANIVARWPGYPALRSTRGQEIFERLKPGFLASFDKAAKPLEALQSFDGFLRGLPAGVQLFSMFEANPQLVDLIVDISATAPRLSRYLSRHSAVLDAVLDGRFFAPWPGREALVADLRERLKGAGLRGQPR